jgi:hypothetical protein
MAGLEPENEVTEGDVDRMEALSAELGRFGEDVEAAENERGRLYRSVPGGRRDTGPQ